MKRIALLGLLVSSVCLSSGQQPPAQTPPAAPAGRGGGRGRGPAPAQPKPEDLSHIKDKSEQIEAIVRDLRAKHADAALVGDVEVYAKAGRFLLEYPELMITQPQIDHSTTVLDQGIERGKALQGGQSPWTTGKSQIHAYYSELDGSVQPYHLAFPAD